MSDVPEDFDRELADLLAQHHHDETGANPREHVKHCPCCQAIGQMFSGLRRDLWDLAEGRRP